MAYVNRSITCSNNDGVSITFGEKGQDFFAALDVAAHEYTHASATYIIEDAYFLSKLLNICFSIIFFCMKELLESWAILARSIMLILSQYRSYINAKAFANATSYCVP